MKLFLTENALGRLLLHFGCLCRGGHLQFHLAGIRRATRDCLGCGR
jgi:hypothetical protein